MPNSVTDRNLLFGILALQLDFISRDALVAAMHAWVLDKAKPLGRILQEQRALTAETHALLDALVEKHLALHGNDVEQSLAAVSSASLVRNDLRQIADPDVQASLVHVAAGPAPPCRDPVATVSLARPAGRGLRFRILRPHARGGLGEVFVAHDEELHREVALKEMQDRHAHDEASRMRFLLEAEITGGLEHPGIVPVYGLGQYADGRPFYAMRFIKGDSLKDAIARFHRGPASAGTPALDLRELLGRFIDVCQAVQYAHDRGVLHRDLKPGNIILGKYGETMVVDWGLAKPLGALGPEGSARSSDESALQPPSASGPAHTMQGSALGTPQYMSPEQAAGRLDQLGPASDIYSLGATLYALLTGRAPVADDTATDPHRPDVAALLRKVQDGDFPRPRQVKPGVNPALEAICLKAMALAPQDRYASPNALIDDLKHWLAGEPVGAWPEPWTVKARRWVDRHRTLVTGIAAAVVVGLVSLAAATVLLARVNDKIQSQNSELVRANKAIKEEIALKEEQRQLAKTRLGQSLKALSLFATDFRLFCEDALVPGQNKARLYEVLIKQLESQVGDEAGEASDDSLRNKVWMYQTLSIVYLDTQQRAKAADTIAKGLQGADQWLQLKPGDPYALSFRASLLELKADLEGTQNPPAAKALYQEVLELRRQLTGNEAVDRFTPGRSLMQLADTLDVLHQYEESLKLREQVVNVQVEKGVEADKLFESLDFWCWTCWKAYVGTTGDAKKNLYLKKADELSPRVLKIRPGARRTLDRWTSISRELADRELHLAQVAEVKRNRSEAKAHWDAAAKYYAQFADISQQLAVSPDLLQARSNYGRSFYALGLVQKHLGNREAARASLETSRQIREGLLRDYANNSYRDHLKIDLLFSLAALGRHAQAVSEADALAKTIWPGWPGAASLRYRLAVVYTDSADAVEELRRPAALTPEDKRLAAEYREKALRNLDYVVPAADNGFLSGFADPDVLSSLRGEPRYEALVEKIKAAKGLATDPALAAVLKTLKDDPKNAKALAEFARILGQKGAWGGAVVAYRNVLALDARDLASGFNLGLALQNDGNTDEAIAAFRQTIDLAPKHAAAHCHLGLALKAQGKLKEAQQELQRGHELGSQQPGWSYPSADNVKEIGRLVQLEQQLPALLQDDRQPASPAELPELVEMCRLTRRYRAAARFTAGVLTAQPNLADDLKAGHRYHAACCAALAAAGQGDDAGKLEDGLRAQLRRQALDWLKADLALWDKQAASADAGIRASAQETLTLWQADTDLAGVREKDSLAKLPEAERESWQKLWDDVAATVMKAAGMK